MNRVGTISALAVIALSLAILAFPARVTAHEQENFVDWTVAYDNIDYTSVPVYTHGTTQTPGKVDDSGAYPVIALNTGDRLTVTYTFRYIGEKVRRGDLFWVTRLGLDFGTIGKYVSPNPGAKDNSTWLGGGSFELQPQTTYTATLVLRSIQPTFRHLHVGVSIQDVGNIPAAPTLTKIPQGGPTLYGVFTDASGPVVDPVDGMNIDVPGFGTLKLIEPWPWAVGGLAAQIVIGIGFIVVMYWFGRWEAKKQAKGGA